MEQQAHRFFGVDVAPGFRAMGTRPGPGPGPEWSIKDWKWDGDLFIATPLDPAISSAFQAGHRQFIPVSSVAAGHSSNTSSSCSDDTHPARELEQRKRKVVVVDDDGDSVEGEEEEEEAGGLTLKLGGGRYPVAPVSNEAARQVRVVDGGGGGAAAAAGGGSLERLSGGKKPKIAGGSGGNRAFCQVEDCGADLTSAKDYHRRHKVCEMHSKASKALVGNVMQRFCQQCSRFHALQEFDEGKRSCRRRLAGHNKRRRKTQPDPITSVHPGDDEQASNYILISLLRLLSNMHDAGNTRLDPVTDQDPVAHLLRSLASCSGGQQVSDISGLLHESQKLLNGGLSIGNSEKISTFLSNAPPRPPKPMDQQDRRMSATETPQDGAYVVNAKSGSPLVASPQKSDRISEKDSLPASSEVRDSAVGGTKLNNFDLNDIYVDSDDGIEDVERSPVTGNFQTGSVDCPSWARHDSQQLSPPQISGNSDSASALSPSSSSGEAQSRTDRIVFKLFGKEPNEFPLMLRGQILDWLAHSPTDMESYIRPGCVILTVYVRLAESIWEEVFSDLGHSLSRFLEMNDDNFWQTGWVVVRLQNQIAFVQNGQIAVNTLLPPQSSYCSRIISITPIAVATSEKVQFQIKGSNLSSPTSRLLCAMEGKYLALEDPEEAFVGDDSLEDTDDIECVSLSCSIPSVIGRGFVEVEDDSIGSSFFPFIVAEKDVCSEIRMLESEFDSSERGDDGRGNVEAKNQATGFINEMGWLLHRCGLKSRLSNHENPNVYGFSFERFTWLMEFSMEHDWSAVVKKLLDVFVDGMVDMGKHSSAEAALSEICLLHKAVRRNSRPLVELLLRYVVPVKEGGSECEDSPATSKGQEEGHERFLFKPDARGPANLTPLHLAAGRDGSMEILDALTDDPGKVGIEAWKNAHDSTGCTPEDYARLRGHYAYIHLVKRKINKRLPSSGSVAVDIPDDVVSEMSGSSKQRGGAGTASLEIGGGRSMRLQSCSACCTKRQISYSSLGARSSLVYRPAMLSMVGIAAVCVCVALLFKSLPDVNVFFRWEMVDYGSI